MKYKELVGKAFKYATVAPLTYTQLQLVEKFASYGFDFSTPTMSNLYKQREKVSHRTWKMAAQAFQMLLKEECGMVYDEEKEDFYQNLDISISPSDLSSKPTINDKKSESIVFHARGRLEIREKAAFISAAKYEVIEIGVSLRTFSSYFFNRASYEYQEPVERLLKEGVHIKCLVLEPTATTSEVYLKDRGEGELIETIDKNIDKLKELKGTFENKNYKGKFDIYTYAHIPYNHFCVIDGNYPNGEMIISPYIFGIKRADAPVFKLSKKNHLHLFEKYWQSIQLILQNSKLKQ